MGLLRQVKSRPPCRRICPPLRFFHLTGPSVAFGSWDNTIKLWDVATGETTILEGHTGGVATLEFLTEWVYFSLQERGIMRCGFGTWGQERPPLP